MSNINVNKIKIELKLVKSQCISKLILNSYYINIKSCMTEIENELVCKLCHDMGWQPSSLDDE